VTLILTGTTTVATWILVGVLDTGITGAAGATVLGFGAGLVAAARFISRSGLRFTVSWDVDVLRPALRLGLGVQSALVLIAVAQRFDQLAVLTLATPSAAGRYSVALTVGQLASFLPAAMSSAAFPRLARLDGADAVAYVERLTRMSLGMAAVITVPLVVALPTLVPVLWGDAYAQATVPAELLAVGGILWAAQWSLARGAVALGRPVLLAASFGVNAVVMLALDLILIPRYRLTGAAAASVIGTTAGLMVCLLDHRRQGHSITRCIPGVDDFLHMARVTREVFT
jgi:O-antigen/teichoic acid export membrane protein